MMARAGNASSASNPLIRLNDFPFTCLPYRSDHRKIYRRLFFCVLSNQPGSALLILGLVDFADQRLHKFLEFRRGCGDLDVGFRHQVVVYPVLCGTEVGDSC
jgi:hypothetical protein